MKKRIVVFGDCNSYITSILYDSLLEHIGDNYEIVAVVNTTQRVNKTNYKALLKYVIKKTFNPWDKNIVFNFQDSFLEIAGEKLDVINIGNVNNHEFINKMRGVNADYAFLIGCPQIFKREIIDCFDMVVNYHNSYLPQYRGLEATSWAMTYGEVLTGYTFHYINEQVDDGNILFQEKIEIDYSKSSFENEVIKTKKASQNIGVVLDLICDGYSGAEQVGEASYYGAKEKKDLLFFSSMQDIKKVKYLIGIWGGIYLNNNGKIIRVTRISNNGKIKRINYIPVSLYRLYNILSWSDR